MTSGTSTYHSWAEDDELAMAIEASMRDQAAMEVPPTDDAAKGGSEKQEITKEQQEAFSKVTQFNGTYFVWSECAAAFSAALECVETKQSQEFAARYLVPALRVFTQTAWNEWCGEDRRKATSKDHAGYFETTFLCTIDLVLHSLERGQTTLLEAALFVLDRSRAVYAGNHPAALDLANQCREKFEQGGGFDKILNVVNDAAWAALPALVDQLQRVMPEFLERVLECIETRVRAVENKDVKEFAEPIGKIIKTLCVADPDVGVNPPESRLVMAGQFYEVLRTLSLRCTASEKWSERRAALDALKVVVDLDKEAATTPNLGAFAGLTDWIAENNVLGDLFGERAHATIVSETGPLLKTLDLTTERLDILLRAALGEMGAVQGELHKVILSLIKSLPDASVLHILTRAHEALEANPDSGAFHLGSTLCDTSHLRSLYDTVDVMQKSEAVCKGAMDLLTSALLSPNCTDAGNEDTFTRVLDSMIHCLKSQWGDHSGKGPGKTVYRRHVMERCIRAVSQAGKATEKPAVVRASSSTAAAQSSSPAVRAAFVLLIEVISLHQRSSGRSDTIASLQEEFNLIDVVLGDVHRLCDEKEATEWPNGDMLKSELWARLEQLRYLLEESTLVLTSSMVDSLWASMGGPTVLCLRWLRLVADTGSVLGPGVAQDVFTRYICKVDPVGLGHHEFNCFEAYFGDVNAETGSMIVAGRNGKDPGRKINGPAFVGRRVTVLWVHDKKMHDGTLSAHILPTSSKNDQHSVRWDDNGRVDDYDWTVLTDWHLLEDEFSINLIAFETLSIPHPDDIVGLRELWQIALSVNNDEVAAKAAKLLLKLYKLFPPHKCDNFLELVLGSLQESLVNLQKSGGVANVETGRTIRRGLGLINTFLLGFASQAPCRAHGYCGRGTAVQITMEYAGKSSVVRTHSKAVLHVLAETWAHTAGVTSLNLTHNGTKLSPGPYQTLEELNIGNEAVLVATVAAPLGDSEEPPKSAGDFMTSPACALAANTTINEQRYAILFNIMDTVQNAALGAEVWQALMNMPTLASARLRVEATPQRAEGDWSSVFGVDSCGFWRSVYALQIVDSMLLPSDDVKLMDAVIWRRTFIRSGGFDQLVAFLRGLHTCTAWGAPHVLARVVGLPVVFRILKFCVNGALQGDGAVVDGDADGGGADDGGQGAGVGESFEAMIGSAPSEGLASGSFVRAFSAPSAMQVQDSADMGEVVYLIMERLLQLCPPKRDIDDDDDSDTQPDGSAEKKAIDSVSWGSQAIADGARTLKVVLNACATGRLQARASSGPIAHRDPIKRFLHGDGNTDASTIIDRVLIHHPDPGARAAFRDAFGEVCLKSAECSEQILFLMQRAFMDLSHRCASCTEFLELLTLLLERESPDSPAVKAVGKRAVEMLLAKPGTLVDGLLVGLLKLLRALLAKHPTLRALGDLAMVQRLYNDFLMRVPGRGASQSVKGRVSPVCQTPESRSACWDLLLLLVGGGGPPDTVASRNAGVEGGVQELARLVSSFVQRTRMPMTADDCEDWEHCATVDRHKDGCFVGLINHGAICYMNAMMQQLYNTIPFRQLLLRTSASEAPTDTKPASDMWKCPACTMENSLENEKCVICGAGTRPEQVEPVLHGEVLRQVQRTFCFLRDSELQSFDPKLLVEACRDLGLHFRVQAQNDTAEFLEKLLERLEKEIGGKSNVEALDMFFRVRISSQLVSVECSHHKEVNPGVFEKSIKVNVQRMATLENSLLCMLSGELMTGDARVVCDECSIAAGKTAKRAMRQTLFIDGDNLPNLLAIQLNRFKFQDGGYKKLNDRLSFPLELDMAPYCKVDGVDASARPDQDGGKQKKSNKLLYQLKGVVVHSGEFGYGHYYSFVRDSRRPHTWYRLDDERVSVFDINDLESECFGGIQTIVNEYCWVSKQERKASAYMLFYQRMHKEDPTPIPGSLPQAPADEDMEAHSPPSALDGDLSSLKRALSASPRGGAGFPPDLTELEEEISDTNEQVMRRALLFDDSFSGFVLDFVKTSVTGQEADMDVIAMASTVFFKSVLHSKTRSRLSEWSLELQSLMGRHLPASEWFLQRAITANPQSSGASATATSDVSSTWLEGGLLKCPALEVRDVCKDLVLSAVTCVLKSQSDKLIAAISRLEAPAGAMDVSPADDDVAMSDGGLSPSEPSAPKPDDGILGALVDALIALVPSAARSWKYLQSYAALFLGLCKLGDDMVRYLVAKDVVAHLVHLYLGHRSPTDKEKLGLPVLPMMGSTMLVPEFDALLDALTILLASKLPLPPLSTKILELHLASTPVTPPLLPQMSTLACKVVEQDPMAGSTVGCGCLLSLLCQDKPLESSLGIITALVQGLEKHGVGDTAGKRRQAQRVEALMAVLSLDDSVAIARVDFAMGELVTQARAKSKSTPHHFKRIAQAIVKLHDLPLAREWLMANREQWTWMSSAYHDSYQSPLGVMRTDSARSAFDALREIQFHAQIIHLRVLGAGTDIANGVYAYAGTIPGHGPHFSRLVGDTELRVWRRTISPELSSWHLSQGPTQDLDSPSCLHYYATPGSIITSTQTVPPPDAQWACKRGAVPSPVVQQERTQRTDCRPPPLERPARGRCLRCTDRPCLVYEERTVGAGRCMRCTHLDEDHVMVQDDAMSVSDDDSSGGNTSKRKGVMFPQQPRSGKRSQTLATQDEDALDTEEQDVNSPTEIPTVRPSIDESEMKLVPWRCPGCESEDMASVEPLQYDRLLKGEKLDFTCDNCHKTSAVSAPPDED